MAYDSRVETVKHIAEVSKFLFQAASVLVERGMVHDQSKLENPEKEAFDEATERLKSLKYGSDEYKQSLADLKPALEHHYANNTHHPEHYSNGIDGMDLYDLIEMFYDWAAAVKRTDNGNLYKSLDINEGRFNMSPQLVNIFKNTIKNYKLAEEPAEK